ncbi:hypothetical protein DFH09DRAFT_1079568 [Mycena vulgaris]|nr:hypothetical protein DFH09DRAFT_1079568 [Mycena vulgaris]
MRVRVFVPNCDKQSLEFLVPSLSPQNMVVGCREVVEGGRKDRPLDEQVERGNDRADYENRPLSTQPTRQKKLSWYVTETERCPHRSNAGEKIRRKVVGNTTPSDTERTTVSNLKIRAMEPQIYDRFTIRDPRANLRAHNIADAKTNRTMGLTWAHNENNKTADSMQPAGGIRTDRRLKADRTWEDKSKAKVNIYIHKLHRIAVFWVESALQLNVVSAAISTSQNWEGQSAISATPMPPERKYKLSSSVKKYGFVLRGTRDCQGRASSVSQAVERDTV